MKKVNIFCVCLLLTALMGLFSCKKDNYGEVYVTVYTDFGKLVEGADVFTVPNTKQGVTDEFGTVLLSKVLAGTYEIYANLNGYGSGKTVVEIPSNTLTQISIFINYGVNTGFMPEITLILPELPANFAPNENIVFSFDVTDKDSKPNDIKVVVSSSLDGKLLETHPDASNHIGFETSKLSHGNHTISIVATDKDNYSSSKIFELSTLAPSNIVLESATKTPQGGVQLKWQKYTSADFKRYEVFRTNNSNTEGQMIASFTSINDIQYLDLVPPIVNEIYYYVRVSNTEGQSRNSNMIKVEEPAGKIFYYSISDAVHHPSEPIIYIIDNASMKLRAINYVTQTEINNISLSGSVGNIDIGDNGYGVEVYVPNNSGFIHVYDANTLNLVTSINTGLDTKCVVTNGHGYLAASLMPSPWWEQPIRTYSRSTGMLISGNGHFEGDRLRFIPNADKIIAISRSVTPTDMDYYELNSSGKILLHQPDSYHGDHPLDANIFRISKNGEFVVTGNVGAVYSASSTMIYKGMIDRGALYFSDFAFSADGNTIYAGTSNRNSLQIVKYPQLTRSDEILIKGYPKFLFNFNGKIISISRTNNSSDTYIFETISLEGL